MHGDYRRLIPTECLECVIDVIAWRDPEGSATWRQGGWVNIGVISGHVHRDFHSWRGRMHRILHAMRGESYPWLEFYSRETLEEFRVAIDEARRVSFPNDESMTT
jgi:hypothetical protein